VTGYDGFLNFCKPIGWTSHDAVAFVRRRLGQQRVGHAGTLDPLAGGVLPLCLGRATRLAERVAAGHKLYAADIVLGVTTDTCDAEGRVLAVRDPTALRLEQVVRALGTLVGPQAQVPPTFSAVKLAGQPAYRRARRGEALQLAARPITIHGIALLGWAPPRLSIALHCSKGTYVRALARDLGEALGCGAYLEALVRLQVGRFTLAEAVPPEALERAAGAGRLPAVLLPPDVVCLELPAVVLTPAEVRYFVHGRPIPGRRSAAVEARAYTADGRFLGLLRGAGAHWQPQLLLTTDAAAGA
jgi:tRNA pseudouridine55 synthase